MKPLKEIVFDYITQKMYTDNKFINGVITTDIAEALGIRKSNVSTILNELIKEGKLEKSNTRPVKYRICEKQEEINTGTCFSKIVGNEGSLKNAIQLAKAAVLYPQRSLNILISAEHGSGISTFASLVYQFAVESKILQIDSPFEEINCHHYSKDISTLNNELFGLGSNHNSYFEKARGGILFIEGFDMLNVKQQALIFSFLETNYLQYDDKLVDYSDVNLILSVTSKGSGVERKVPAIIELPPLSDRPFSERLELINRFYATEAQNSNRDVKVTSESIKGLLLTKFAFNLKELRDEIMASCANAYIRVVTESDKEIFVCINDFTANVKRGLLLAKKYRESLEELLGVREYFIYGKNPEYSLDHLGTMYGDIKTQYDEMTNRGIKVESIEEVMNKHIKKFFDLYSYSIENDNKNLEHLSKIVDRRIISLVTILVDDFEKEKNVKLKSNIFYGLCLHTNSLLSQSIGSQRINNDQIVEVIQNYPDEYTAASQFVSMLKKELNLDLDIAEVVIIALFLIGSEKDDEDIKPVLLYIMHGNSTAKSLSDVTNSLTQCSNAYSYDLTLDSQSKQAVEEIKTLILKIDQGAGVIIVYDMGSIKTMVDAISEEIDVKIRYMNVPVTLLGIDIARKCSMEGDIDSVYHSVNLEYENRKRQQNLHNTAIVTLCHTGEGGALQLKNYIDSHSRLGMKTIALAISNRDILIKEILDIRKAYNIHAFVGTYDPKLFGIPYIPISSIFEVPSNNVDRILMFEPVNEMNIDYSLVYKNLSEQFTETSMTKLKTTLPSVVEELSLIYNLDGDQALGLFVHIAGLIERVLSGNSTTKNPRSDEIIKSYSDEYRIISKIIRKIEKVFKIIIDDYEIANLITMVKKI
ncbi:transcriptional regulator [Erysipelotrichaceae bacterium MTC7]|nr:transcriptional regulator [Erysipelotrichaceae bacterium MTC7]